MTGRCAFNAAIARYLRIATSKVCATASPLEFLQPASRAIAVPAPA